MNLQNTIKLSIKRRAGILVASLLVSLTFFPASSQAAETITIPNGGIVDLSKPAIHSLVIDGQWANLRMEAGSQLILGTENTLYGPRSSMIRNGQTILEPGVNIHLKNISALGDGKTYLTIIESHGPSIYNENRVSASTNPLFGSVKLHEAVYPGLGGNYGLIMEYESKANLKTFAASQNQLATAKYLDEVRINPLHQEKRKLLDAVFQLRTPEEVSGALKQVSGNFRANSLMIGITSPWTTTFDRMNLREPDYLSRPSVRRHTEVYRPMQYQHPMYHGSSMIYQGGLIQNGFIEGEIIDGQFFEGEIFEGEIIEGEIFDESQGIYRQFVDPNDFDEFPTPPGRSGMNQRLPSLYFEDDDIYEIGSDSLYQYMGQCPSNEYIHFWVNPYYNGVDARDDGNSSKYNISRTGFLLGGQRNIGKHSAFGITLGYSDPVLSQDNARVTANDYHIGVYGGTYIKHIYEFKGYMGYGRQEYQTRRNIRFGGYDETVHGQTNGDSFAMSLQFARPFRSYAGALWKPLVAIDINNSDQDAFSEYGSEAAYHFNHASLTKTFFRFGATREKDHGFWRSRLGLSYSAQIGGDDTPDSISSFVVGPNVPGMTEYGVDLGRNFFNASVGLEYFLNRSRTASIFGGYDAHISHRASDQTASLGFRWMM